MVPVLFYVLGIITLGSALAVAFTSNLVRSVFMFFITLFGLAGLYVLCLADFVAITQIVIYVGGILVLILFAFMLSGRETLAALQQSKQRLFRLGNVPAVFIAIAFLVAIVNSLSKVKFETLPWITAALAGNDVIRDPAEMTANIGVNLMTRYLLPFEGISVLLLMALIGAAHLARKEEAI